jgi:hypothetical protein
MTLRCYLGFHHFRVIGYCLYLKKVNGIETGHATHLFRMCVRPGCHTPKVDVLDGNFESCLKAKPAEATGGDAELAKLRKIAGLE